MSGQKGGEIENMKRLLLCISTATSCALEARNAHPGVAVQLDGFRLHGINQRPAHGKRHQPKTLVAAAVDLAVGGEDGLSAGLGVERAAEVTPAN